MRRPKDEFLNALQVAISLPPVLRIVPIKPLFVRVWAARLPTDAVSWTRTWSALDRELARRWNYRWLFNL